MAEYIVMGPGNFKRNGKSNGQGVEVELSDQEFAGLSPEDKSKLCRRGCTMADMENELAAVDSPSPSPVAQNQNQGNGGKGGRRKGRR